MAVDVSKSDLAQHAGLVRTADESCRLRSPSPSSRRSLSAASV